MTVHVYRNLRAKVWSIRQSGKVVAHQRSCILTECRMVVQPGGLARARRTGHRNVHAYVKGWRVGQYWKKRPPRGFRRVSYHFSRGYFYFEDTGSICHRAAVVVLMPDGSAWVDV